MISGGLLQVAVDFGTTNTCAAMSRGGMAPEVIVVDGAPLVPSAVYAAPDGTLFVGREAQRQAGIDPARYEPHPKRRIDEGELLLGDTVVPVVELVRAVLDRMVTEARRSCGGVPVDQLVLTHPADWGSLRPAVLRRAGEPLARQVVLISEPVAATMCYLTEGHLIEVLTGRPEVAPGASPTAPPGAPAPGTALAVLDLGGGTVDASVLQPMVGPSRLAPPPEAGSGGASASPGVILLAHRGDPAFGGADIDEALLEQVGAICSPVDPVAWRTLIEGRELADFRRRQALLADVRTAKETLSRHAHADVPLPPPFPDVHVTRADLERLIRPALGRSVDVLEAALADARCVPGQQPGGVFLVGGSSRIPLVARLVYERTGILPRAFDVPETVVARGALQLVRPDPTVGCSSRTTNPGQRGFKRLPTSREDLPGKLAAVSRIAPGGWWSLKSIQPRQHRTGVLLVISVLVVGVVGVAALLAGGPDEQSPDRRLAAYGYSFALPPGWEQTGGAGSLREVRLTPSGTGGPGAVFVQQNQLDYDSDLDPARPRRELQTQIADAQLAGTFPGRYASFDPEASFAGREVSYYREHPADGSLVDWYVLFQGQVQVSVGCRYTPDVAGQVEQACREVVRTLQIR